MMAYCVYDMGLTKLYNSNNNEYYDLIDFQTGHHS